MTGRRGKRHQHILAGLKEKRGYCELDEEALDRTVWRTHLGFEYESGDKSFGSGYGPVARHTTE